ncbi:hypothetical protein [Pedobacter sp. MC2016-24]|uniref:hypothetical protein n=1 Tax=Pedobacter sp. MC2016-24 TaxID=2780090 RepID=UPI00187E8782|nr:hypothetical protein [Pedobacter sp. MC2016-24]MBE9599354.1 hypothetical protein [Pedobacter sp. MC2016-24]
MSTIAPAGYVFFLVIALSFTTAYFWLAAKKKARVLFVFLAGSALTFALLMPAMISLQLFEAGNQIIRIAIVACWLFLIAIVIAIQRSKKVNLGWSILINLFLMIGGLMLVGLMAGMGYFVYLRLFTHERDDAPMWSVFLCIFFLGVLILAIAGQLLNSGKRNKEGKTEFNKLKEALLMPEIVLWLDLSGQNLTSVPADVLKFSNLTNLDLSNNQINQLPNDLARLTHLATIKLSGNPISDQERSIIRKMFPPETQIIFRS